MKSFLVYLALFFAGALIILAVSFLAPLLVPYYQDFSVMYFSVKGLLAGIPIYDYPAQLEFVKGITPAGFSFYPYPYPPWYALSTFYLGFLPIQVAARAWFLMNITMFSLTAWLLTPGWKATWRILACLAVILFIPAFGLLVVGQYSAPVLLGTAIFLYSSQRKLPFLSAIGLLLLTFKPHVGGLLIVAGLAWLLYENSAYARRALLLTIVGGVLLAGLGFLADPAWPLTYFQSLARYRDIPGVQTCGLCASLPVTLFRLVTGVSNTFYAAILSLGLALPASWLIFGPSRDRLKNPAFLMAVFSILTLLLDPYLLNYDYVLLLVPLFLLIRRSWLVWVIYILPWVGLVLGRNGNILLSLCGLVTFILILFTSIDSTHVEAYNQFNN